MKKNVIIASMVALTLVGCAKNEVVRNGSGSQEDVRIFFNAVAGLTSKVIIEDANYPTDGSVTFGSVVYYVGEGKEIADGTVWVPQQEIVYDDTYDTFSTKAAYYYPKDNGSLTFFSFSPWIMNDAIVVDKTVKNGVTIPDVWDVDARQDCDFMVAESCSGVTSNPSTKGVNTVFSHKLAQIRAIKIWTADAYDGNTYTLNSLTLKNLKYAGTYSEDVWTPADGAVKDVVLTLDATEFDSENPAGVLDTHYLMMPQVNESGAQALEISYTATNASGLPVTNVATLDFYDILSKSLSGRNFLANYRYTINLYVEEETIFWDASVVGWDEESVSTNIVY